MTSMRRAACVPSLASCIALVALAAVACNVDDNLNGEACYPGDFKYADASADGARSFVKCARSGEGYEAYDGDPMVVPEAGGDVSVNCDPSVGPLGFMCTGCTSDNQCTTGKCVYFMNKGGNHCTHSCTSGAECVSPLSGGCGNQGVCKPL
jgi:hypothetical protein